MNRVIERIYKRTTEYSHPSQATTTANALDLLSSGIYTEEERFIFELLQNAVDSFDANDDRELRIKIVLLDDQLIFMHNGTPFSERDLEGLCDIGNGNKMNDAKKIGYKGIGFKSVFMHSHLVAVLTNGTCFKFDKEACEKIVREKGTEYIGVKMPWQIIPMLTEIPSNIDTSGFNVVTYIQTYNRNSLRRKVEKLLADTRFLLFLKVNNLRISFYDGSEEVLKLSKSYEDKVLTLLKNDVPQNRWLIHSKEVKLPSEVRTALNHDTKVPTKLKESDSVEISFAIALDEEGNIVPLKDAVMYTYLPTSYSIGLSFVVNANFITDAGRQQIAKDCVWNEFIFSQIPGLYLNWIAEDVALHYSDWYKVLPHILELDDELSHAYSQALSEAIKCVPFVKTINGRMVLVKNAICDYIDINSNIPLSVLNNFVHTKISENASVESLVSLEIGRALERYDIACVKTEHAKILLEKSETYLADLSAGDMLIFLIWLKRFSETQSRGFLESLSYAKILIDENSSLIEPIASFFPSEYSEKNPDITEDAKIIKQELAKQFDEDMSNWLQNIGVHEMSNITVIDKVLCEESYIKVDNAIDVLRFIFECHKRENIFKNISERRLANIKILTSGGRLLYASELYLSDCYNPICKIQKNYPEDIFVSELYPKNIEDSAEWALFFQKLGCANDIKLSRIKYGAGSWVMQDSSIQRCVQIAKNSEYNTAWDGRKFYLGCAGGTCVYAVSSPLITFDKSESIQEFYKLFWERIFADSDPSSDNDCIFGETGFGYTKSALLSRSAYLGKTFVEWLINSKELLPATDGKLHTINKILINSDTNVKVFGKYYPVLAISKPIRNTWVEKLTFKQNLTLSDYLIVLDRISQDDIEKAASNKDRINRIYELMSDNWDFTPNSTDYIQLQNWGKTHKLLSKEGQFEYPSSLYLLSSHLSGVDLNNQVYHSKHLENSRFALMMEALGVNIITDHRVNGLEDAIIDYDVTNMLLDKCDFLTAVVGNDAFTEETWSEAKSKMGNAISNLSFYKVDSICICYGYQEFEKTVYSKDTEFYYVGKFGLANQELLHGAIMKAIDFPQKARTIFLTILQMTDLVELKEYLEQKGYDTSFIIGPQEIVAIETSGNAVVMSGQDESMGGLTREEMRNALVEAKDVILDRLMHDGFDISQIEWDGWTCIDGVKKDGVEFPLVIRSNKSQRNTCLSPMDWNQLMKPNAMFAVVTNNGIGTISLREILRSKEKISIQFSSENIENSEHIKELSQVFAYFKGIQFNFDSYIHPVVNQWERFVAPEQSTGELPVAVSTNALPE